MATGTYEAGAMRAPLTAATDTTGGGVLSLANPEGIDLLITRFIVRTTAPSAGAASIDAGIAADGVTTSDTLIDGLSVASAAKVADNVENGGTNGLAVALWGASQFVTITASATTAGMVGEALIQYVPA